MAMMKTTVCFSKFTVFSTITITLYTVCSSLYPVCSQIIPDQTLPHNSFLISPDGQTILINGGTQAGSNLFHSFQEFNVNSGQFVLFNNGLDITNIFSRVTGNNISLINGGLGANGTANLFLINPNGITFGQNAQLLLGGSFIGTTASQINFADGGKLDVLNPNQSLLTVSAPIGLQFQGAEGKITVQNRGHSIVEIPLINPFIVDTQQGLQVKEQTLALVSNQILFDGGIIHSESGNIELASVQEGVISLVMQPKISLQWLENSQYADISFQNLSLVHSFGRNHGAINIYGKNINVLEGSFILSRNFAQLAPIKVIATENINVSGHIPNKNPPFPFTNFGVGRSAISTESLNNSTGANINISATSLNINAGGIIGSRAFGSSTGGDLNLSVEQISISDVSPLNPLVVSGLIATTGRDAGNSGNAYLETDSLSIFNGGVLGTSTLGQGNAGNVIVQSNEIEVIGVSSQNLAPSLIKSDSFNTGDGGQIFLDTHRLIVSRGGLIDTSSIAFGNAGDLTIEASESILVENSTNNLFSSIRSAIDSPSPEIQDFFGLPRVPQGNAGNVNISSPVLKLQNEGQVTVRNVGLGNAGNINLNVNQIELSNSSLITAATASGQGGNIVINSERLSLNNSQITATAGGLGDGGNITMNNNATFLLNHSQITANAFEGRGGNIEINTGVLFPDPSSIITASSELGIDGEVHINQIFNLQNLISPLTLIPQQKVIELRVECTEIELIQSGSLHETRMIESGYVAKLKPSSTAQPTSNGVEWREGRWVTTRYFTQNELDSWQCSLEENSLLQSEQSLSK